jgi:hypothetical protein
MASWVDAVCTLVLIDESRPAIAATHQAILFSDLKAGYTARNATILVRNQRQ